MAARVRILALTEDSGSQAQPTLQKLLKEALKLVVEGVDLNPAWVRIEPLHEKHSALLALRSTNWKTRPPTRETILLLSEIATRVLEPGGFVVFHFDTDRAWSERDTSENRKKFEEIIYDGVRRTLRGEAPLPVNSRPRAPLTDEQVETALGRLLVLSPCYTIESWLYQATNELLAYCRQRHTSEEHERLIGSWAADRTLLDEISQPKDNVLRCVGDRYNEELAKAFPAGDVWLAERSFYESVERLRACSALVEALGY